MDLLAEARKRAAAHTDYEAMDVEPLSYKAPEKADKGKAAATLPLKRKVHLPLGPREKLMKDALRARAGEEKQGLSGEGAEEGGGRFIPAWKLSKETNLGTVAERREWATFALPPKVRAGFTKNSDREIEIRTNAAVLEVLGLFDRLTLDTKTEAWNREELKEKLEEGQRREEVKDAALKAAETENKKLMLRYEDMAESKEEMQRRLSQLIEVRNFWAAEGAELVVKTCLKSPEVYYWLLEFAGVMMNIGYSSGVKAVYTAHLADRDQKKFKDFAKGDVDAGEQIMRRVTRFRHGEMAFEFLDYLAANPGLSFEELREMEMAAYRRLDGSYGGVVETPQMPAETTQEPAEPARSLGEGSVEREEGGSDTEEQPTLAARDSTEAEDLMKEADLVTGGSWDPDNTQGFGMPK